VQTALPVAGGHADPIELSFEITPDDEALPFETGRVSQRSWAAQLDVRATRQRGRAIRPATDVVDDGGRTR
jgi:hypothetical protein